MVSRIALFLLEHDRFIPDASSALLFSTEEEFEIEETSSGTTKRDVLSFQWIFDRFKFGANNAHRWLRVSQDGRLPFPSPLPRRSYFPHFPLVVE